MFSDNSSISQGNILKRHDAPIENIESRRFKLVPSGQPSDELFLNKCLVTPDFTTQQNLESRCQTSPEVIHFSENSEENLDSQKDFNYSQKLFHISDGNLYSIFSPIQGRSYGMKPSFLRKQKYTVQECHNRGRKNLRKGLKFHNFLPSQSVTSEKDNGFSSAKWKVYSECRLREEHGTKQITISNWSQSIQNPPGESSNTSSAAETSIASPPPYQDKNFPPESSSFLQFKGQNICDTKADTNLTDPYDFNLNSLSYNYGNNNVQLNFGSQAETAQSPCSSNPKKEALNLLLNSLIQKPMTPEKSPEDPDVLNKCSQKHRRKPVQTRRVVPYMKYLSIMEENESLPLDLSSKCLIENSLNSTISLSDDDQIISKNVNLNLSADSPDVIYEKNVESNYVPQNHHFTVPNIPSLRPVNSNSPDNKIANPTAAVLYPYALNKNSSLLQNGLYPPPLIGPSTSAQDIQASQSSPNACIEKQFTLLHPPSANTSHFTLQKSSVKEVHSKPRRRNQRSVIKQKLEDSFRQNGFLVKTKQVSDGEATFCKFRQLRKCTRYYLKSLEQHLPDEFHKMLKGFLPPKTVLPPVIGSPDAINESLT